MRHGQWLGDGSTLVAVSDASGEERVVAFAGHEAKVLPWDTGHVTRMRAAPQGSLVAFANHRNEVWIGDVASGELHAVDASADGRSDDLAWSPDGAWLAYTFATSTRHVAIKLHEVAAHTSTLVTEPEFRDYSPSFDPDGKYLYFLSLRTYDPVYDSVQFEMSFPRAARPYLIALQAGGRPPFEPDPKGLKGEPERDAAAAPRPRRRRRSASTSTASPTGWRRSRSARTASTGSPAPPAARCCGACRTSSARTAAAATRKRPASSSASTSPPAAPRPWPRRSMPSSWRRTARRLVYREGKRLRAIAVDRKPGKPEPGENDTAPSRKSGWLDLERLRISVEPPREWQQMLREVWRLQRDQFWSADMSGVDWEAAYRRYAPLVARVATRADLSDLIWEMQGELGTSHAYEMGGDHRKPPAVALGYLGCELRFDAADGSWEIARIVRGDPWDAGADSPLNAVGVEARPGERIVAVGGQPVSATLPPQALLVHQAGAKVQLTLKSGPGSEATLRDVTVTALADEVPARYREWVEKNRAWVHAQSNGRVGYFHLPDMMAAGFAEFHRYFGAECEREALIVDVRYNRGGHVSQLLLEKVARRRLGYVHSRWQRPGTYPEEAVAGPVVALTNEHAGSDGDIFSHTFKLMKIGPLVGTRTWGGVVGIQPRHALIDGTQTTQPEYAFWFNDVGWDVENYGTDPEIEVDNAPQDHAAGRDRQLETALATALGKLGPTPAAVRRDGPRPRLLRPALPPRQRG